MNIDNTHKKWRFPFYGKILLLFFIIISVLAVSSYTNICCSFLPRPILENDSPKQTAQIMTEKVMPDLIVENPLTMDQAESKESELDAIIYKFYKDVFSADIINLKQTTRKSPDDEYPFNRYFYTVRSRGIAFSTLDNVTSVTEILIGNPCPKISYYSDTSVIYDIVPGNLQKSEKRKLLRTHFKKLGNDYDKIPKEKVFALVKPVLQYYELPLEEREYMIVPRDCSDYRIWLIKRFFSYKGIVCAKRCIIIQVSRFNGRILSICYNPVFVPNTYVEKIGKADAQLLAKNWLSQRDFFTAEGRSYRFGEDLGEIDKIITAPSGIARDDGEKEYYSSLKQGEVRYCWSVPVFYKEEGNGCELEGRVWVDMETGKIIGRI